MEHLYKKLPKEVQNLVDHCEIFVENLIESGQIESVDDLDHNFSVYLRFFNEDDWYNNPYGNGYDFDFENAQDVIDALKSIKQLDEFKRVVENYTINGFSKDDEDIECYDKDEEQEYEQDLIDAKREIDLFEAFDIDEIWDKIVEHNFEILQNEFDLIKDKLI